MKNQSRRDEKKFIKKAVEGGNCSSQFVTKRHIPFQQLIMIYIPTKKRIFLLSMELDETIEC